MRALRYFCLIAGAITGLAHADEQPPTYERSVGRLWGFAVTMPLTVQWCREHYPQFDEPNEAALRVWQEKHAALTAEMDRRVRRIFSTGDDHSADVDAQLEGLRKMGNGKFLETMSQRTGEDAKLACAVLPVYLSSPDADPTVKYAREIEIVRARPEPET